MLHLHSVLRFAVAAFLVSQCLPLQALIGEELAVDFNREIRPILTSRCLACHGRDKEGRKGDLRLDDRDAAIESGAIVPGKPEKSELIARVTADDEFTRMPPAEHGGALKPEQIATLKKWIAAGAPYAKHWSLVTPTRAPVPDKVADAGLPAVIDYWVENRLAAEGMKLAPAADRYTLARRASLTLRGLPPSPEEVEAFVNDDAPDAYERYVDRLLADKAYGERWARVWLDLARYADSKGYGSDPLRTIWRYRDWVIEAHNQNMPYDEFTIEQLAGDLLPAATLDQKIATAFHRNTMSNDEGGTDDEEFRVAAVKDRVDTTAQVWLGLTMGCAQCHDHKYDPISQREYYQFYDFFNQTADADRNNEAPLLMVPLQPSAKIAAELAELEAELKATSPELEKAQAAWEVTVAAGNDWQPLASEGVQITEANDKTKTFAASMQDSAAPIGALRLTAVGENLKTPIILKSMQLRVESPLPEVRFVRIENSGKQQILHLAEVQVFSGGKNVAQGKVARQSSTDYDAPADRAVDGKTNGDFYQGSVTHNAIEDDPWWEVDLGAKLPVEKAVVWNRTDNNLEKRLSNWKISFYDADRNLVWQQEVTESPQPSMELTTAEPWSLPTVSSLRNLRFTEGQQLSVPLAENVAITGKKLLVETQLGTGNFSSLEFESSAVSSAARRQLPADVLAIVDTAVADRTDLEQNILTEYYRSQSPLLASVRNQIAELKSKQVGSTSVPVMEQLPEGKRRESHIMIRGNFLSLSDKVSAGTPKSLHTFSEELPTDRLGLAEWLFAKDNPLTARVHVNRLWARVFGVGIVETEEDFGSQGEVPTHPELLDWLACEFCDGVTNGSSQGQSWDQKALLKQIVLSKTYQQSSQVTQENLEKDPRNRLLSRGPRFRLEAEMIRDQALALSGLLSEKMYGPSVYPPQPPGLWRAAFNGRDRKWETSTGEDRYRRGLYTFWRRSVPYPSMATFDAPSREICTMRRLRSSTPLQAMVTMNDPCYVEAAQALARRILNEGGDSDAARANFALKLCYCRPASENSVETVLELLKTQQEYFASHPEEASEVASKPLGALPAELKAVDAAAWTQVAAALLNTDAVLTQR